MYESRKHRPLSRTQFASRLASHLVAALLLLGVSLGTGMLGYMRFEGLAVVDAFLNAAMLLGGMGPVNSLHTSEGKIFAGAYALYSGLIFIVMAALIISPIAHRLLHKFHSDSEL